MRKTKLVIIPAQPATRDSGKAFLITEFDAMRAEKWATRALLAVLNSGGTVPDEIAAAGAAAVLAHGWRALVTMAFADAEPLLDEMMQCIEVVPDRSKSAVTRPLDKDDIEEVATLLLLRSEVIEVHTGFSVAGFLSKKGETANLSTGGLPVSPTSPNPSGTS